MEEWDGIPKYRTVPLDSNAFHTCTAGVRHVWSWTLLFR